MRYRCFPVRWMSEIDSFLNENPVPREEWIVRKKGVNMNPFTRNRVLSLRSVFYAIIDVGRETLCLKVRRIQESMGIRRDAQVSAQAFSKARAKMSEKPFEDGFNHMICWEYAGGNGPAKKTDGHGNYIFAVDGSKISLPNLPAFRESYFTTGAGATSPTALASVMFDALNHRIVRGDWSNKLDERAAAVRMLDGIGDVIGDAGKIIITADRGYPSEGFIRSIQSSGCHQCLRVKSGFSRDIDALPEECDTHIDIKGMMMRVLRFTLDSGNHETLVTDLEDYSAEELKHLYHLRWSVETEYLSIKDRLELENFTGKTDNSVKQDFWATLFADLMLCVFEEDAKPEIDRRMKDSPLEYKTNRNVLVGVLRDKASIFFLSPFKRDRDKAMKEMQDAAQKFVCPIKPGRKTPRAKNKRKTKFSFNNKSNC